MDNLIPNQVAKSTFVTVLINSQFEEFTRYKDNYRKATGKDFPITFGQYTGQEDQAARERMREPPPHILLTNYMMLELLLTRTAERSIRDAIYQNLKFLVFDDLHTYRGRQGADVGMLIRRIQAQCERHSKYFAESLSYRQGVESQSRKYAMLEDSLSFTNE